MRLTKANQSEWSQNDIPNIHLIGADVGINKGVTEMFKRKSFHLLKSSTRC